MRKSEYDLLETQWDAEALQLDPEVVSALVSYEVEPEKSRAFITFRNEDRLNALPLAGLERVGELVREAETDDRVKTIVFRGAGPCFGTGADARELGHYIGYKDPVNGVAPQAPSQRQRMLPDRNIVFGAFARTIAESMKATLCAVHSYCYGGHLQLALAADLVLATPDALFTHPGFRYLGPAHQDMYQFMENLGVKRMKEMMLTGRAFTAEECREAGFVNAVVDASEMDDAVDRYTAAIAAMPLDGIMMGKAMMRAMAEARGKGTGEMNAWMGHGWCTNIRFQDGEFNFLRSRYRSGVTEAVAQRDAVIPEAFRIGKSARR